MENIELFGYIQSSEEESNGDKTKHQIVLIWIMN